MDNNLYLVKRTDRNVFPDEMMGAVVSAPDELSARVMTSAEGLDEGSQIWLGPEVSVTLIGKSVVPTGVVQTDTWAV